jgi:SAM-dependent methyltransferase
MPEIESTHRVAPESHRNLAEYLLFRRHRFAYDEAFSRLPVDAVVADVGCGYGYALEMLAGKARQVYAIDAAETALRCLPDLPNVQKVRAFADAIPLESESVDCVVAFQLLEHLPAGRVAPALHEFLRILRPGGRVLATTPNARWRLFPGQRPWNPYHVLEYTAEDLAGLCRASFGHDWRLRSVVGRSGAQAIEIARVAPNRMQHHPRGLRRRLSKLWTYYGPARVAQWRKRGTVAVADAHRGMDWFEFSDDPAKGLDLWLEIRKF